MSGYIERKRHGQIKNDSRKMNIRAEEKSGSSLFWKDVEYGLGDAKWEFWERDKEIGQAT